MAQVTVLEALTLIDANKPTTLQYFGARGLLDQYPSPPSVWASDHMRHKLQQRYKKKIFSLHPDKRGIGDSIELHQVKAAWAELKKYYHSPIDLISDVDSNDSDDEEEHTPECKRTTRDNPLNACDVLVACVACNLSESHERGKSDFAENSNEEDAQLVDDANLPVYECYICKSVRKNFWFQGRATSLDIGKT